MYEELTVEGIKRDILSRLSTEINVNEGSFTNDIISAVAYEVWKAYQSLDAIVPIAFVDENSGIYIDKRCAEYGIVRKPGAKAAAVLDFTGTDGTVIAAGKMFLTPEGLEFFTNEAVTITNSKASVLATAAEIGEDYNVAAGTITNQLVSLSGLSSVTNRAAAGGANSETDAELVKRLYTQLQNPTTSGNVAHYKQWALAVDGVGAAKVVPLWNGAGTVKVLIVGSGNEPVDSAIVANCAGNIEKNRPIGANVTVVSASGLNINVSAKITIDGTTTLNTVKAEFEKSLKTYLNSIAFSKYTLVYNRVAHMLLDIKGVVDYTTLTVNGIAGNITIGDDQVPVMGTVVIS